MEPITVLAMAAGGVSGALLWHSILMLIGLRQVRSIQTNSSIVVSLAEREAERSPSSEEPRV